MPQNKNEGTSPKIAGPLSGTPRDTIYAWSSVQVFSVCGSRGASAFYVVGFDLIVIERYLLIVLTAFSVIAALLYPISKFNLLRFLFGMRMKNRAP